MIFFFSSRRRHTRSKRDWSSDVCSSDLKASAIIGRVGPVGTSVEVIKDISEMEGQQIYNLIKSEQPQTISFLLSYLDTQKATAVFTMLSPELDRKSTRLNSSHVSISYAV